MKKLILFIFISLSIFFNNYSESFANLTIGTGGIIENINFSKNIECVKYDKYSAGSIGNNKNFYDLIEYNYSKTQKKENLESKKNDKFNQCEIKYSLNEVKNKYENFYIYNKMKKSFSKKYDKIFTDSVQFEDTTNECTFTAKKGDDYYFILYGKEIGKYKIIHSVVGVNTKDGKANISFSAELGDGRVVIVENGIEKYYSVKGLFKEGTLKYTHLKDLVFVEKDPFFGKEHLVINGKKSEFFSGYEVNYSNTISDDIDLLILDKNENRYFLDGAEYYINGKKEKNNFGYVGKISYLSNGKIIYIGNSLNQNRLIYLVINGKKSKGYYKLINISIKKEKKGFYGNKYPYLETKKGDIYIIEKDISGKFILIKNGKEIDKYNFEPEIYPDNGNNLVFIVKKVNGKFILVINGEKSKEFDEKPKINNQYFFEKSKNGIMVLDFKYNNFDYVCSFKDFSKNIEIKRFRLKRKIEKRLIKFLRRKLDINKGEESIRGFLIKEKKILNNMKKILLEISVKRPKLMKIIEVFDKVVEVRIKRNESTYKSSETFKELDKKFIVKNYGIAKFINNQTLELKSNYTYKDFLTNHQLFSYLFFRFRLLENNDIKYLKKVIKNYIKMNGHNLLDKYELGTGYKERVPFFVIESKYILNFPRGKRLKISFGLKNIKGN